MKKLFLLGFLFSVSCVAVPELPAPLSEQAPQVVSLAPDTAQKISTTPKLQVIFSKSMDPDSFKEGAIFLTKGVIEMGQFETAADLYKSIDKGVLPPIALKADFDEEEQMVTLTSAEELSSDETYTLLITSRILSKDHIPLNQDFSKSSVPFVAVFQTINPFGSSPDNSASLPQGQSPAAVPSIVGQVVINEIYYDAVGSDTDGVLFIELYGTPGLKIGGAKISFVNGEDGKIYDSLTLSQNAQIGLDGFFLIADAKTGSSNASNVIGSDMIDNFDPQNGPDAVQLVDSKGVLVDAVGYGSGMSGTAENGLASFEGTAALDVVNGHSLERKEPGLDTNDNSQDFVDRAVPTPGK
jgi:hypothetical protein